MAKKKKKQNSAKRGEENSFSSSLAAKLQNIDVEVKKSASTTPPPARPAKPAHKEPAAELTDEQLFLKAMEEMPSPSMQRIS